MSYTKEDIHNIVEKQRQFFNTGITLDVKYRIEQLKKLKKMLKDNQEKIIEALHIDLGRSPMESYLVDIGDTIMEIDEYIKGVKKWNKPEKHFSGLACFPSFRTHVYKIPYGVTLIISPFNFPVMLSIGVVAASIAGGNTALIKCSSKSAATTAVLKELISKTFKEDYLTVIDGGHDIADYCLEERVDKIFYTGSPKVAKHVMELASKNLTPVALELGGETGNWCVAFFKILNSGQICININQVAVASEVADEFIKELKAAITKQIGEKAYLNEEYPKMITERAWQGIAEEAEQYKDRIVFGGEGDKSTQKYSPTIIYPVDINEPIVNHEIFGPLLPVVKFDDDKVNELLDIIASREHGLALYIFTKNKKWAKKVMRTQQYGGGCVNEVCLHIMVKGVPFNGVGHSGIGAYHGKWGFNEFTHPSTVLFGKAKMNLSLREHPYTNKKKKLLSKFLK